MISLNKLILGGNAKWWDQEARLLGRPGNFKTTARISSAGSVRDFGMPEDHNMLRRRGD